MSGPTNTPSFSFASDKPGNWSQRRQRSKYQPDHHGGVGNASTTTATSTASLVKIDDSQLSRSTQSRTHPPSPSARSRSQVLHRQQERRALQESDQGVENTTNEADERNLPFVKIADEEMGQELRHRRRDPDPVYFREAGSLVSCEVIHPLLQTIHKWLHW
ncbi:hypothetical protein AVEN_137652-1 [Araneus ventricosus]|uniref:Uncharacterized protein n=1 Tax=Araneus ventricosus TaxID=182803 RepID=A0A4Y2UIF9_ARAVE|nr:hypothetical protein AVEN_137652-1 [Araneus ventricosus]